ncbi:cell surface A33 antigen-like [Cyprinodon tularosa]|uniref:cell surface A33 antigen-like n=1 Tax=Cyprinodon tularosa TaxID=77115 RepID=UPI0018E24818|nr:cell surface A33 antigen-like [Cyprinodon tularosa]
MIPRRNFVLLKIILLITVFTYCSGLKVSIPEKEYKVRKGEDVTLTCSFVPARPIENNFVLVWDVIGTPSKAVAAFFKNSPVDIAPAYEGRASLEVDLEGGVSTLQLTKVTMEDSRLYQCSVRIPNDDEGTPIASTSVLVLEPPSKPICTLQGKAEYYSDITLTCKSEEGSPAPTYQWTSYSVDNIQRQFPPKTTEKDGVLSLFNITRETSGFFICISQNNIGSASCNFTLAVMPPSMGMGSTAIIIGIAVVLGALLLLGIIIFCYRKRKSKKEATVEGAHGDKVFYDKEGSEVGEPYLDDKSTGKKLPSQYEDSDIASERNYVKHDGKGSDTDSHRYHGEKKDYSRGSRDNLDNERDRYGSRDRLDDRRDHHRNQDPDDQRNRYGSRDRLDDQRDRYGSRDRLDDQHDRYRSQDRNDHRDHYGSRDRLDDQRGRYGSRDRLDDYHDQYSGGRDVYHGSRDRIDYRDD